MLISCRSLGLLVCVIIPALLFSKTNGENFVVFLPQVSCDDFMDILCFLSFQNVPKLSSFFVSKLIGIKFLA